MTVARIEDVAAGFLDVAKDIGAIAPNVRKLSTDAGRAPLPSDDETQGYEVGSRWQWQGREWVATSVTAGAARWLPKDQALTPEMLEAVGDGVADDTAALQQAFALMAGGNRLVGRVGATYRTTATIISFGAADLDFSQCTIFADFDGNALDIADTAPAGPFNLTSDYVPGSLILEVAPLPYAPRAGSRIRLFSLASDPGNRNVTGRQVRVAEWAYVAAGSTTTTIQLMQPLRFTEGMSAGSRVPAYTVAMGARVVLMADEHRCEVRLPSVRRPAATTLKGAGVRVLYFRGPVLHTPAARVGHGSGLFLLGTDGAQINAADVRELTDNLTDGNYGYGVSDAGHGTTLYGGSITRTRHAYTTGESYTTDTPSMAEMCSTGRVVGASIIGGVSTAGTSSAWDTHHGAEDIVFSNPVAIGGATFAYGVRGRSVVLRGPRSSQCQQGIQIFSDYQGGLWLAGDRVEDYTSGTVIDPRIDCVDTALAVHAARATIAGDGYWTTRDNRVMQVTAGNLHVCGHQLFVVKGGFPRTNTGLIDATLSGGAAPTPFTSSEVVIDGDVTIDARAVVATDVYGLRAMAGGQIIVRGRLRLLLPAGASLLAGGGSITCEGAGVIEYSIEGASGIAPGLTGRAVYVVDLASGQVFDGTNRRDDYHGYNQITEYGDNRLIVRHPGQANAGLRLRNTNTAISNGQNQGGITFETNDLANPSLEAFRMLIRGYGSSGFVDAALQRTDVAGSLFDALILKANGDIHMIAKDGSTVGVIWKANMNELQILGSRGIRLGSDTGPQIVSGAGAPEGVVTAPIGSIYLRSDGGAGTAYYVKESGTGSAGWVAK